MPLSKQALVVLNNVNFPNNNTQYISPELLRQFNSEMIISMQLTQSMSEYAVLVGANSFVGNQTITGDLTVSGVISASVLHVQYETASVIFSTGSNQLGDELTDTQTLSGSVKVQGSLTVNGTPVLTSSADVTGFVTTSSFNAYTQSTDLRLTSLETNSASVNISISNLNQTTASLNTSVTALNSFTQSQNVLNGTFATTGSNTFTGNQIIDKTKALYTNALYWTSSEVGYKNLEIINQAGGNLDFASLNGGKMRVVSTPLILTGSALSSSNDISTSANIYAANLTGSALPTGIVSSSTQILNYNIFATTGSNTFTGINTFTNEIRPNTYIRFPNDATLYGNSGSRFSIDSNTGMQLRNFTTSEYFFEQYANAQMLFYNRGGERIEISGSATRIQDVDFIPFSASLNTRILAATGSTINTGSFATTGSNTFVGNQIVSGTINTTQDITVSGVKFGFGNPAGTSSIAIGNSNTLQNNTYDNNIAIGDDALKENTVGSRNIGIGVQALQDITGNSNYNVGIGGFALSAATASTNTFALGYAAMESAQDSTENIAIGVATLANKKANSNYNTAIGSHALREHRDGDIHSGQNMAFGYDAMRYVTSGSGNTAIGPAALRDAPRANENVFIGLIAGFNAGHVDYNTVIGARAATAIKSSYNTIIGQQAASSITSGSSNTIIGQNAAVYISSGSSNTIIGQAAGAQVGGGDGNTFIGHTSGYNTSGSNNTFIGPYQGKGNESGVIALSDGAQNLRAIYNSGWVFTGSVDIQNTLTASLSQGFTYVGDANGRTIAVSTSSFASTINTGSFATTGSNSFNGNQTITGSLIQSSSNSLIVDPIGQGVGTWIKNRVNISDTPGGPAARLFISGSDGAYSEFGRGFLTQNTLKVPGLGANISSFSSVIDNSQNIVGVFNDDFSVDVEMQFFANSSSVGLADWDNGTTFSYVPFLTVAPNVGNNPIPIMTRGLGISGSLYVSGNIYANNLTGSSINTGSFATTGSNTFVGNQIISAAVFIDNNPLYILGQYPNITMGANAQNSGSQYPGLSVFVDSALYQGPGVYGAFGVYDTGQDPQKTIMAMAANSYTRFGPEMVGGLFGGGLNDAGDDSAIVIRTGSATMYVEKPTIFRYNANIEGSLTASLANGYVWVGNGSNRTTLVATSSFGGGGTIATGSFATTGSNTFTGNQLINKNGAEFQMTDPTNPSYGTASFGISGPSGGLIFKQSGSTIMEGQIGTTNMTFYGNAQVQGGGLVSITGQATDGRIIMLGHSGSLALANSSVTNTYASLSHISSSQPNANTNIIFKTNNNTGDTIISGSSNLFVNPATPTTGFKRYIGGSGNVMLNASNVPQISGSMTFSPTMNNNLFGGQGQTITMRGPVSSSGWNINSNNFLGSATVGQTAANHAQGMVSGFSMTGNYQNGVLSIIANKANLTQLTTLTNNNIGGTLSLTAASSSISWIGSTTQGNVILTNTVSGSGATVVSGSNGVYNSQNIVGGGLTINATGNALSDDPTGQSFLRSFERNIIGGNSNIVSLNGETTSTLALVSTAIIGNNLTITGSSASPIFNTAGVINYGSAFFGRYNAQDGNKAKSAQTIFAVGTGTSTSNRKTGFLIDSGSNSFFEGIVNISGSLLVNGVSISGSGGTTIDTGSFATTGSNSFVGNQTITGSLRVSGSTTLQGNTVFIDRSGSNNSSVYLGENALANNTTGGQNVALGQFALSSNTTGNGNFALGLNSLSSNVEGNLNVAIGGESGRYASGSSNIFIGGQSGKFITGSANTIIGSYTGTEGDVIQNNIIFADGVGNVRAQYNGGWQFPGLSINGNTTITGSLIQSGAVSIQGDITFVNKNGDNTNVILGSNAMSNITGSIGSSVAIGIGAMRYASGSSQNVAIGQNALAVTTGTNNFALGSEALTNNTTGNQNVAIGVGALNKNTTGQLNTSIGNDSGFLNVSGSRNTYIGPNCGNNHFGSGTVIIGGYSGGGQILNDNIILSDGNGVIKAQYSASGSAWLMKDTVNFTTGSNQQAGTAVLDGGNPGTVTVSNSLVTANSIIMLTKQTLTNAHMVAVTAKSAGSFTITSNGNGDSDTVGWFIINNS